MQFAYSLGWTLQFTYPLMCAVQLISAQIGRVTGRGLAGNIRRHYPVALFYPLVGLPVVANTINLGADLGAMACRVRNRDPLGGNVFVAPFMKARQREQ